ncbi:MAG: hypothetical protein WCS70_13030, partial [Verrucomicrobiota bacterium]
MKKMMPFSRVLKLLTGFNVLAALLLAPPANVFAADSIWTNTTAGGNFGDTTAIWSNGVPGVNDNAIFTNNFAYSVTNVAGASFLNANAYFNGTSGIVTGKFGTGTWTLNNSFSIGQNAGDTATVVWVNGTLAVTNNGNAKLIVGQSGQGTLALNGGNLIVDQLFMTNNTATTTNSFITSTSSANVTILNGSTFKINANSLSLDGTWVMAGGQNLITNVTSGAFSLPGKLVVQGSSTTFKFYSPGSPSMTINGTLIVTNGAKAALVAQSSSFNQVQWAPGGSKTIMVANAGSALAITNMDFNLATDKSSGNSLIVSNGASFIHNGLVGLATKYGGGNNSIIITDSGSTFTAVVLNVAIAPDSNNSTIGNHVDVLGGANMYLSGAGNLIAGASSGIAGGAGHPDQGNYLRVSGAGSVAKYARDLTLGQTQSGLQYTTNNYIQIDNGGTLIASNLTVSVAQGSGIASNNYINVTGGNLYVTNTTAAGGNLVIGQSGQASLVIRNGGLVTVDNLIVTNYGSYVQTLRLNGGQLIAKNMTLALGADVVLGNGTAAATNTLNGGYLKVTDGFGLVITNAMVLNGTGTVVPAATVKSGGTLSPGTSLGTLVFSNNLTLAGTLLIDLANGPGTTATGDFVNVFGTLNVDGATLAFND